MNEHLNHTRSMGTLAIHLAAGAGLVLAIGGASAYAQQGSNTTGVVVGTINAPSVNAPSSSVVLSSAQKRSMLQAFVWLDRDAGILDGVLTPSTIFVETPGLKERTNYLNVQVKSRAQMIAQVTREAALAMIAVPQSTARNTNPLTNAQVLFEARMAQADQRLIEARDRLAPSVREAFPDIDMHSIRLPAGVSAEVAAEALMQTGDYDFVSIDWLCYPTTTPNDPLFNTQWHHGAARIDTVGAWDFTQGNASTIIGICDSGVDLNHPDLAAALVPGFNAVDNIAQVDGGNVNDDLVGHGTLVAGSAAAIGNNGVGLSGVGWNFGIMPVRVSNSANGSAFLSDILQGARWASDNGAYASNCSFGGAEDASTRSSGGHIRLEGHLLVFAAGNDGLPNQTNDWLKVTIVGASTQADNWATWSHTGIGIDCIAPGVNIRSTNRTGGYSYATGTSFASPITAGSMMLVHDANPALTADEVEFILLNACDDKQAVGQDDQTGWGRINVRRAVQDAIFGPSITSLPFADTFAQSTLSTDWRNPIGTVLVSQDGVNEPSAPYALNLDDADSIETIAMRAAVLAGNPGEIRFWSQHRGVETGESLTVEYFDMFGVWRTLTTLVSDGQDQINFGLNRFLMPAFAMHDQFKLRLVAAGSDITDDWYIDDVAVQAFTSNPLPWSDSFENGITLTLDWASSSATPTGAASNEPDGVMSAQLVGTDSMTSAPVDISQAQSAVYIHFYTQHAGVEAGETLDAEYLNLLGIWKPLATITSDGVDQSQFSLTQLALPLDGYGSTTSVRFTANGNEPNDTWFLDAVAVTTDFIPDPPCLADLTGDGLLNFFDVSAFLVAFNTQDPIADLTGDGLYNFFDVSAFLTSFAGGCP